jgi:hypothetical protein
MSAAHRSFDALRMQDVVLRRELPSGLGSVLWDRGSFDCARLTPRGAQDDSEGRRANPKGKTTWNPTLAQRAR